jgi:hypothetical protein
MEADFDSTHDLHVDEPVYLKFRDNEELGDYTTVLSIAYTQEQFQDELQWRYDTTSQHVTTKFRITVKAYGEVLVTDTIDVEIFGTN